MKILRLFTLTLLLLSVFFTYKYFMQTPMAQDSSRFIAHAGGAIEGFVYTNSLEALQNSYNKGFRLFELDMVQTSDGIFVAAHDWEYWKKITQYNGTLPPTHKEFKSIKLHKKFTPLDMNDINNWFAKHTDAILVTDKVNSPSLFVQAFDFKERLIMELFTHEAVQEAIKENIHGVMPSYSLLASMKGGRVKYLTSNGLKYLAVSRNHLQKDLQFFQTLKQKGIKVYAFHVNQKKNIDEKYMLCNEMHSFYGIYADNWNFSGTEPCQN